MMKRIAALLLVLLLALPLTGCEFTSKVMCVTQNTSTSFSMTYAKFSGRETVTIRHHEDGELPVRVKVESEAGTLNVTIGKKGEEPVYTGNALPTGEFVVYLNETGSYTVTLEGKDHTGGVVLDWSR